MKQPGVMDYHYLPSFDNPLEDEPDDRGPYSEDEDPRDLPEPWV